MLTESINFNAIPWQSTLSGARSKTFQQDGKQLRIVEFTDEFVESDWCINGHVGYVLEGTLEIDFNGRLVIYPKGSGIFIPAGAENAHKARAITPVAQLVLVEELI